MKTHCIDCGQPHGQLKFPKKCQVCGREMYQNPIPVVVVIVPLIEGGILVAQRGIAPQKGHWALPGGFMEVGETYQESARRELKEELNLNYSGEFKILGIEATSGQNLLIMLESEPISLKSLNFSPNEETLAVKPVLAPQELAFPIHTNYLIKALGL